MASFGKAPCGLMGSAGSGVPTPKVNAGALIIITTFDMPVFTWMTRSRVVGDFGVDWVDTAILLTQDITQSCYVSTSTSFRDGQYGRGAFAGGNLRDLAPSSTQTEGDSIEILNFESP